MPHRSGRKRGRKPFHPWAKWIGEEAGHTVVLIQGRDYACSPVSMDVQLRRKATEIGYRVTVQVEGKVLILTNNGAINA